MSEYSYPHELYQAAKLYPMSSTAYANLRPAHNHIALRVQAPEIMMQFVGDVDLGKDPKGRLFYKSNLKWPTNPSTYKIFYHKTSTPSVVVRVDFYEHGRAGKLTPFARFLADSNDSQLPPIVPGPGHNDGHGKWAQLKAATCPMRVTRLTNSSTVNLGSHPIHKQAYFASQEKTRISEIGFLFFTDLAKLKTRPNDLEDCVAEYSSNRIVFHIEGKPNDVVARFLPTVPIDDIGQGTSKVIWEDIPALEGSAC